MGNLAAILPDFEAPAEPLADAITGDAAIAGYLRSAREHLGLEVGFIARWVEGQAREITHVDTVLELPLGPGFRQHREETYCWHVLNGTLPELITDPADYPFTQQLHITTALPVGCHISVPLQLSDGTNWGSFCILGRTPDASLNPRDLAIVESFAAMAVERIEQLTIAAAHHEQTRQRIEGMFDGEAVTIYQQPIHDLATGKPVGVECLARFPDVNKRGPGAWFEDAESAGLGVELEMTAIHGALETLDSVPEGFFASVKTPTRTILSGQLSAALAKVKTGKIVITLTQHAGLEDGAKLAVILQGYRAKTKIAIDGVGADYSSLKLISLIQPDYIKLDMRLTRGIAKERAARAMVAAVVELASTFSGKVIAEGIEDANEADAMRAMGVAYGQGYHFARPLPMVAANQHLMGISA